MGKGDFALTDVKEMDGTEDFFDLDVKVRKCQNDESVLDCEMKKYLEIGRKECKCIPHHLRVFSMPVSNFCMDILYHQSLFSQTNKVKKIQKLWHYPFSL